MFKKKRIEKNRNQKMMKEKKKEPIISKGKRNNRRLSVQLGGGSGGQLVGQLLLLWNGKSIDAQEVADTGDHQISPAEINHHCEEEISPHVKQLQLRANLRKANSRKVTKNSTSNQRSQHDSPVWEWLTGQVRKDDFGSETSENKGHGAAKEDEVVVLHERAVRRKDPSTSANGEDGHWNPLEEHGKNREILRLARTGDVQDAKGDMGSDQQEDDHANPDIPERDVSNEMGHSLQVVAPDMCERLRENVWPVNSGDDHDAAGNEEAFRWAVDDAEVERMRMVSLPR